MCPDFGFSLNKSHQIDLDKANLKLYHELTMAEPSLKTCIFCGTCSATCTASKFTDFSFRKISLWLRRGMNSEVREMAKKCMLCGKCVMACPRNVNTRNVLFQLNKISNEHKF